MENYPGEIRVFAFGYAPKGWAFCNGQTISIAQNAALFALLGTYYGGDGRTNFALPNLQGNVAIGMGQGPGLSQYSLGAKGGVTSVTLTTAQLAAHGHSLNASSTKAIASTANQNVLALSTTAGGHGQSGTTGMIYSSNSAGTALSSSSIATNGGGQAHNNMQAYLQLNYCIALQGNFPPRQ